MYQKHLGNNEHLLDRIGILVVLCILTTLALSTLNLNSYFIILLLFLTLLKGDILNSIKNAWKEQFFRSCTLLFIVFVAGIFYTTDWHQGLSSLEKRVGLVAIPFIFCSKRFADVLKWKTLVSIFSIILFLISAYCLVIASIRFIETGKIHHYFYHDLVSPLKHHAVYFSILLFIAVISLIEEKATSLIKNHFVLYFLTSYFILFIILLSSKLVIILLIIYLAYKIFKANKAKLKWYITVIALLISLLIVVFTKNPVKSRFNDAITFDIEKFTSKDLSAAYFNGVEFRLIQWKLVFQILNEKNKWLLGVSPADAQTVLNDKYKEYHFYQGDPRLGDKGFLDYNVHNQFLQCLLQSGLIGLLGFIYVCYSLIRLAIKKRSTQLRMITVLLIAFCFTESVLQTQKGLVCFTLFPLLIYFDTSMKEP